MAKLGRAQVMVAQDMIARGVAVRQVARQLGVTEGALRYWLRQRGERADGRRERASALDGWEDVVTAVLERFGDARVTADSTTRCQARQVYDVLGREGAATSRWGATCGAQSGWRVYYGTLADLITSLEEAQAAGRLSQRLKTLVFPSLLVVDELGYLPISRLGAMLFFQLMSRRYEHASTVLTSTQRGTPKSSLPMRSLDGR